jgi:hypothetical protein
MMKLVKINLSFRPQILLFLFLCCWSNWWYHCEIAGLVRVWIGLVHGVRANSVFNSCYMRRPYEELGPARVYGVSANIDTQSSPDHDQSATDRISLMTIRQRRSIHVNILGTWPPLLARDLRENGAHLASAGEIFISVSHKYVHSERQGTNGRFDCNNWTFSTSFHMELPQCLLGVINAARWLRLIRLEAVWLAWQNPQIAPTGPWRETKPTLVSGPISNQTI